LPSLAVTASAPGCRLAASETAASTLASRRLRTVPRLSIAPPAA
jgi:hypothetical protein